jgi:hypothetical protein
VCRTTALGYIGGLPQLMKTIGSGLAEAGEQAGKAVGALVGDDGEGGARRALSGSADTMNSATDKVGEALAGLGTKLSESGGSVKTLIR